jgi:hypothetical protein
MRVISTFAVVSALEFLAAAGTAQAVVIGNDTSPDGAYYLLSETHFGNVYTFTFTADFSGAAGSDAIGDYVSAISIASTPGNVNWTAGSVSAAPYGAANWSIAEGVVTSSNGCPPDGSASKDFCLGLDVDTDLSGESTISTSTTLTWSWTMTLTAGTPSANDPPWSYKFVSTTGNLEEMCSGGGPNRECHDVWEYGNYQISRTLGGTTIIPEPATLLLVGSGAALVGLRRRRTCGRDRDSRAI